MTSMHQWARDAAERSGRTFLQFYLGLWMLRAGLVDSEVRSDAAAFDLLFTMDNLKAGVVGLALALAFAVGARQAHPHSTASFLKSP